MSITPRLPTPDETRRHRSRVVLSQIIYLLFCLEVGVILVLLPWTLLWDNNYFFSLQPEHSGFWLGNHLRGAVSGVGVVNLWMGVVELLEILGWGRH